MYRWTLFLVGAVSGVLFRFQPALADAIDGDWCRSDGKRMTIRGPAIVTPGGRQTNGDYNRHFFFMSSRPVKPVPVRLYRSSCSANT